MKRADLTDELLRRVPVFGRMHDSERRQLAEIGTLVDYPAGAVVLKQGGNRQSLWIVLNGRCEVFRDPPANQPGSHVRLATLEPFSNFGEMSFFHPATHSANVRAETAVTLLRIERGDFDELVEEGASAASKLACNVIDVLAERLRRMDEWVVTLVQDDQPPEPQTGDWARFRDRLLSGWNV